MKYIHQACCVFLFTFLGEALARLLPLPVPAAIWGLILLFLALCAGIVRAERLRECAHWMVAVLPVLFVAPTVNLRDYAGLLLPSLPAVIVILPVCGALTFFTSGRVTQRLASRKGGKEDE